MLECESGWRFFYNAVRLSKCIVGEPPIMQTVLTQTRHKCIVREPPIKNRTLCQMDVGRASSEDCLCATPNFITWLRYQRSLQGLAARTHCASLLQSSEPQAPQSSEQLCLQGLAARTHCASLAPAQSPASAPPPRPARVREESAGESAAHQLTVRAHQGLVQLVIDPHGSERGRQLGDEGTHVAKR